MGFVLSFFSFHFCYFLLFFCYFLLVLNAYKTFSHLYHFQKFLGKAPSIGLVNKMESNLDNKGANFTKSH